jgi:Fic family protein
MTMNETQVVIMHGLTVGGKTLAEHIEAVNHKEALTWVLDRAKAKGPSENCTIEDIQTIHKFILAGSNQAGQWREDQVMIAGSAHVPPRPEKIPYAMASMMNWLEKDGPGFHPVERAARLHADLVTIHPFIDGNGRTARRLMNLELIRSGFPAVVIHNEDRLEYYNGLQEIQERGIFDDFLNFVCRAVEGSFAPYWHLFDVSEEQIKALTQLGQL